MTGHDLMKLLISGNFSDLKITCPDGSFNVHKNIVCHHSDFFAKACTVDMKEKAENLIQLPEPSSIIDSVLRFCYSGEYWYMQLPYAHAPLHHAQVYTAADKYGVTGLRDLAKSKFADVAKTSTFDVANLLEAITHIYENTYNKSDPMRKLAAKIPLKHEMMVEGLWAKFLQDVPEYAFDLIEFNVYILEKAELYWERFKLCRCIDCHAEVEQEAQSDLSERWCTFCGSRIEEQEWTKREVDPMTAENRPRSRWDTTLPQDEAE